ncbi:MAG: hypothetical protein ACYC1U_09645 [Candidatus Aquicultorales bacterium]
MSYLASQSAGKHRAALPATVIMIVAGLVVLSLEWLSMKAVLGGAGLLPDLVVFVATYSPVLAGAGIGTAVYHVGRARECRNVWLAPVVSGALTVPLVVTDPWVIVALGMRGHAPVILRLILLALPVIVAGAFAYPLVAERRLDSKLSILGAVLLTVYVAIYWFVLPTTNLF